MANPYKELLDYCRELVDEHDPDDTRTSVSDVVEDMYETLERLFPSLPVRAGRVYPQVGDHVLIDLPMSERDKNAGAKHHGKHAVITRAAPISGWFVKDEHDNPIDWVIPTHWLINHKRKYE